MSKMILAFLLVAFPTLGACAAETTDVAPTGEDEISEEAVAKASWPSGPERISSGAVLIPAAVAKKHPVVGTLALVRFELRCDVGEVGDPYTCTLFGFAAKNAKAYELVYQIVPSAPRSSRILSTKLWNRTGKRLQLKGPQVASLWAAGHATTTAALMKKRGGAATTSAAISASGADDGALAEAGLAQTSQELQANNGLCETGGLGVNYFSCMVGLGLMAVGCTPLTILTGGASVAACTFGVALAPSCLVALDNYLGERADCRPKALRVLGTCTVVRGGQIRQWPYVLDKIPSAGISGFNVKGASNNYQLSNPPGQNASFACGATIFGDYNYAGPGPRPQWADVVCSEGAVICGQGANVSATIDHVQPL
jgi:hypothetical protein